MDSHGHDDKGGDGQGNELCCCPPTAHVWIETEVGGWFVEQRIHEERHVTIHRALSANATADVKPILETRSATNSSVNPPGGPSLNADSLAAARTQADSDGASETKFDDQIQKDHVLKKDQGKVYRVDTYTVHWEASGEGPLRVSLRLGGAISQEASWLPKSGKMKVTRTYMLEPPAYQPPGPDMVTATLEVTDCCRHTVRQSNTVQRP